MSGEAGAGVRGSSGLREWPSSELLGPGDGIGCLFLDCDCEKKRSRIGVCDRLVPRVGVSHGWLPWCAPGTGTGLYGEVAEVS